MENLYKVYGKETILNRLKFVIKEGEFLSILGASGCGKTTLLRILIGISKPSVEKIIKDGKEITLLDSSKRGVGIVFQNYALFPNMTVLQNLEYALKFNNELKKDVNKIVPEVLERVKMSEHVNKLIHKLSGGQQQRVAIARTLALQPGDILFDEPLSTLDVTNRLLMRNEIKRIQKETGTTIIYITHDQEKTFTMPDRMRGSLNN